MCVYIWTGLPRSLPTASGEEMKNSGAASYSCTYRRLDDCENIIL